MFRFSFYLSAFRTPIFTILGDGEKQTEGASQYVQGSLHKRSTMTEELKTILLNSREDSHKITGRLEKTAINGLSPILLNRIEPPPYCDTANLGFYGFMNLKMSCSRTKYPSD